MDNNSILMYSDTKYKFCVYHEDQIGPRTLYALMETEEEAYALCQEKIKEFWGDTGNQFYPAEIIRITFDITTFADKVNKTINRARSIGLK